jgi:hypothetical protein
MRASAKPVTKGKLEEFKGKKPKPTEVDKQQFWSELLHHRYQYGKDRKWALAIYRRKFKAWPRGLYDIPRETSAETRSWITHSNIARARSRGRAA